MNIFGTKKIAWGTFTNANGDTGGNIDTGMNRVDFIALTVNDSAAASATSVPTVNETLPIDGSAVTILCLDGQDGYWWAFGS
jgi:hypothetical protein